LRKHTEDLTSNPQTNMVDHSSSAAASVLLYMKHPMTEKKALSVIIPSIQHQIYRERSHTSTFCHHPIDPTPDLQRAIQHQYAEQEMKLT
jgi:hypothetical protein